MGLTSGWQIWMGVGLLFLSMATQTGAQDRAQLSQQLDEAVAQQDWDRAVQVVDRMIEADPSRRGLLEVYRQELLLRADPVGVHEFSGEEEPGSMLSCGEDVNCLLAAASACQPSQARFASTIDQSGISGSGVNFVQIQGQTPEGCRTVSRIESLTDLDLSGIGILLGNAPNQIPDTLLQEFLQETDSTCLYGSGSDLRSVLEVDLGRREGSLEISQLQPAGQSRLEGPMTLDGRTVAQCQIQLPNQLGGVPFDFSDLF